MLKGSKDAVPDGEVEKLLAVAKVAEMVSCSCEIKP